MNDRDKIMRTIILAFFALLATFPLLVQARSVLTADQMRFEKKCLLSGYTCMYQLLRVTNQEDYESTEISYVSIDNAKEYGDILVNYLKDSQGVVYLGKKAQGGGERWVAIKRGRGGWDAARAAQARYPLQIRFISTYKVRGPVTAGVEFSEDFKARPRQMRRIIVEVSRGAEVFADWTNNNIHYYRKTHVPTDASFGGIIINMDGWSKDYDGSYYIITTRPSWGAFARQYSEAGSRLVDGVDKLPVLSGSPSEIAHKALVWMSTRLKYDDKKAYGAFPSQTIRNILGNEGGDCKGLDFVFRMILARAGLDSHPSKLSSVRVPPRSFSVMDPLWGDHIITYIPRLGAYVDVTIAIDHPDGWMQSSSNWTGATALDLKTGRFAIVNVTRKL